MRNRGLTRSACLLLAAGMLLAACGGGGGGSAAEDGDAGGSAGESAATAGDGEGGPPTSGDGGSEGVKTTSESKAEFTAKANAVCNRQRQKMQKKAAGFVGPGAPELSVKEARRRLVENVIAPGFEAEARRLRQLGAPQDDEPQVEAIVDALEATAAGAIEDPDDYIERPDRHDRANELARSYGVGACGTIS